MRSTDLMAETLHKTLTGAVTLSPGHAHGWAPGAGGHAMHTELFAPANEASGGAAALAFARDALQARPAADAGDSEDLRSILWVQDIAAIRATGRPYRPGFPSEWRHRLIHVAAQTPEDALFALEEGLRCRDLACVIGEIAGNPKALGFTQSRRLSLTAEKHGVPLYLVRLDAARDLSSARMRWDMRAAPSPQPCWNAQAPGIASWQAELFRSRRHRPGQWVLHDGPERLRIASRAPSTLNQPANETEPSTPPHPLRLAGAARLRSLAAV